MTALTYALLSNHGTDAGQQAIKEIAQTCQPTTPTIGYMSSAVDSDRYFYHYTKAMYARIGLSIGEYIDLEEGFHADTLSRILDCPMVHLSGGNTFQFLQGVQRRGVLEQLKHYAFQGGKFIGLSAGALLLTPDINVSVLAGDEATFAVENTKGVALADFQFIPHATTDHIQRIQAHSRHSEHPIVLCDDFSAVLCIENTISSIGSPTVIYKGEVHSLELLQQLMRINAT